VVSWFRQRREVRFERIENSGDTSVRLQYEGEEVQPALTVRIHKPRNRRRENDSAVEKSEPYIDLAWDGKSTRELESQIATHISAALIDVVPSLS